MISFLDKIGELTIYYVNFIGMMGVFLARSFVGMFKPPYKIFPITKQIYIIGSQSIFVVAFIAAFTGAVLGLQGYHTLRQFGSEGLLGSAVALSLIRELGPVLTALMVTGRAGSAMCAEIGIMRVSEQIDALECMAIDPYRYLIAPKFAAGIISLPLLNFVFDVVGIFGGYVVGVLLLGVESGAYFSSMQRSVVFDDIYMGLVKSLVFGLILVWICSSKGYHVHLERSGGFGAEGVSRATTGAVVLSSVSILVWDYLITAVLL
jgi:phospholipid/cholesterol/gamma-HCH transport system permease protein